MIIDSIGCLHGFFPKLEGGDLLIVTGDLTARDIDEEYWKFNSWLKEQKYKNIVVIAGNHDNRFVQTKDLHMSHAYCHPWEYLCDSGCTVFYQDDDTKQMNQNCLDFEDSKQPKLKSLKVWGSPWTKTFPGMNPKCKAFTVDTEEELAEKFSLIPDDIDILITHSPPHSLLDQTKDGRNAGSISLMHYVEKRVDKIKLHVFGHIHEAYGENIDYIALESDWPKGVPPFFPEQLKELSMVGRMKKGLISVNASHVNERYQPVNKPIRIVL